ncbi:carbohydrate kinase family protein [Hyphomicrobium sp. ghe19]|uniref:carbohydrate kinase family protein n=1 Tax=Hyphomicrobium sp. ghe19 TaxID=2682968 RepID=UPI001366C1FD|nr:putative sugar kinase YdjH [Hyphomicrobium sp. ghe19]
MNVLTIGGAMVDTIVTIASDKIEQVKMRNAESSFLLLEEGHKTEAEEIASSCGGGAVNAAVTASRLGHNTSIIAKIGRDDKGKTILGLLRAEGVDVSWIAVDDREPTGSSVIISSHDRNAAVFTYRGANTKVEANDLPHQAFAGRDLVYVANLSNQSANCYPLVVEHAKAAGALLAVNPGVRQLTARFDDFWHSLKYIDILCINRTEAQTLMPRLLQSFGDGGAPLIAKNDEPIPPLAKRGLRSGGYEMSLVKFLGTLIELGVGVIVLTDGANGAFIARAQELHYRAAEHVVAAATTGAGDAFSSTFACYLADTQDPGRALSAAAINAASVVKFIDTQTGLLTRAALEREIERASEAPLFSFSI